MEEECKHEIIEEHNEGCYRTGKWNTQEKIINIVDIEVKKSVKDWLEQKHSAKYKNSQSELMRDYQEYCDHRITEAKWLGQKITEEIKEMK